MTDPRNLMELGWKARENLEFDKAEELLKEALEMFEEAGDWFNVTEALNHLAYTQKLRAEQYNFQGNIYTKRSLGISKQHATKNTSVIRALMSLTSSAGLFEQALYWCRESLKQDLKPLPKADILSHLATFYLRTGDLNRAKEAINEAEQIMEDHESEVENPHRSIWKSRILLTKGIILFDSGDKEKSRAYLEKALETAKSQDLKSRIKEIEQIMEMYQLE